MNILKFFSLIGLFLIFLSNGIEAHMHAGLKGGFDKFAKNQGYSDFSEYLEKKELCAKALNLAFFDVSAKQNADKVEVDPPKGYHWMKVGQSYELMKNGYYGYTQHKNSSLTAHMSLFGKGNSKEKNNGNSSVGVDETAEFFEVDPPKGFHWMKVSNSYELMKNPGSGYFPHKDSSLVAPFRLFSPKNSAKKQAKDKEISKTYGYKIEDENLSKKVSSLLEDKLWSNKYQDIETAIKKVNKKNWSINNCNFSMFIEKETFTRFLESIIMNQEPPKENKKKKPVYKKYGY